MGAELDLGPYGLARRVTRLNAPPCRQRLHDEQAASVFLRGARGRRGRRAGKPLASAVGDLDAQGGGTGYGPRQEQSQEEVPSGHATVLHGVGGEFGHEQRCGARGFVLVVPAPVGELLNGEATGEACTAQGGAEALAETAGLLHEVGRVNFLRHVTERGRTFVR